MDKVQVLDRSRRSYPARRKNRVLVVNVFFDDSRRESPNPNKVPQAMGHAYLAAAFAPHRCDLRLYNEGQQGPLQSEALLSWPDMLVLTGLTIGFDRMRHLTAYARSKNPRVIVVAGGPAVRALPNLAGRYFDYCCSGDVEQMREVVRDALGEDCVSDTLCPRYDLVRYPFGIGYVESSRYCNFKCSFCALTGEKRKYAHNSLDYFRAQILALGRKRLTYIIDNNFYGNDRSFFLARLEIIRELRRQGRLGGWTTCVTGDFFANDENLELVREAGCQALFSGVESFDEQALRLFNKRQNLVLPQLEMIRKCLDHGVIFLYGMILDPAHRSLADLGREIDFVLSARRITLPSFFSLAIPILGTPSFTEAVRNNLLLPELKLRDLDGMTLTTHALDPLDEVAAFVDDVVTMRGRRRMILSSAASFLRHYGTRFNAIQLALGLANAALLGAPGALNAPLALRRRRSRSYIATTEPVGPLYRPVFPVATRYESYFRPTRITDATGALADDLALDYRSDGSRLAAVTSGAERKKIKTRATFSSAVN